MRFSYFLSSLLATMALVLSLHGKSVMAAPVAYCDSGLVGLPCIGKGNDKEAFVEASLQSATGYFQDLVQLATSGEANNILTNGYQFEFVRDGSEVVGGNWVDTLVRDKVLYMTIKSANEYMLIDLTQPSSSSSFTWYETQKKKKFQGISHVSLWGVAKVFNVPEPGVLGLMGLGLIGLGFVVARRRLSLSK